MLLHVKHTHTELEPVLGVHFYYIANNKYSEIVQNLEREVSVNDVREETDQQPGECCWWSTGGSDYDSPWSQTTGGSPCGSQREGKSE